MKVILKVNPINHVKQIRTKIILDIKGYQTKSDIM